MMLDMEHKIYLSRGKRLDNKQWVYGAVLFHDGNAATIFNQHTTKSGSPYTENVSKDRFSRHPIIMLSFMICSARFKMIEVK